MALNVALPLSGLLPELMYPERYALLSPIPQDFEENLELLVTPYESSESGIGSSSETKVSISSPLHTLCLLNRKGNWKKALAWLNENVRFLIRLLSSTLQNPKSSSEEDDLPSSTASSVSTPVSSPPPETKSQSESPEPTEAEEEFDSKIEYRGRDVLDLAKNLTDTTWKFQYARLPENNVSMFMANRSQYHRLGANGLNREYDMATCNKCTFQFPVINPNINFMLDGGAPHAQQPPAQQMNDTAQNNNMPSFKMYKHF